MACGIASAAWRVAYDKPDATPATAKRSAFEVARNPKVRAHVAARKQAANEDTAISVAFLTEQALGIAAEARAEKQYAAASGALQFVARLHGLLVDKREVTGTVQANVQVSGEISARAIVDRAHEAAPVIDVTPIPAPTHDAPGGTN